MEEIRRQRQLLKEQETALKGKQKIIAKYEKSVAKFEEVMRQNPIGYLLWQYRNSWFDKDALKRELERIKEDYEKPYKKTKDGDIILPYQLLYEKTEGEIVSDKFDGEKFLEAFKNWFEENNCDAWIRYGKQLGLECRTIILDWDGLKDLIVVFGLGALVYSEADLLNAWRKEVGIECRDCNICYEEKYCVNGFYKASRPNEPISNTNAERSCLCKVDVCVDCVKKLNNKCPTCRTTFNAWGK